MAEDCIPVHVYSSMVKLRRTFASLCMFIHDHCADNTGLGAVSHDSARDVYSLLRRELQYMHQELERCGEHVRATPHTVRPTQADRLRLLQSPTTLSAGSDVGDPNKVTAHQQDSLHVATTSRDVRVASTQAGSEEKSPHLHHHHYAQHQQCRLQQYREVPCCTPPRCSCRQVGGPSSTQPSSSLTDFSVQAVPDARRHGDASGENRGQRTPECGDHGKSDQHTKLRLPRCPTENNDGYVLDRPAHSAYTTSVTLPSMPSSPSSSFVSVAYTSSSLSSLPEYAASAGQNASRGNMTGLECHRIVPAGTGFWIYVWPCFGTYKATTQPAHVFVFPHYRSMHNLTAHASRELNCMPAPPYLLDPAGEKVDQIAQLQRDSHYLLFPSGGFYREEAVPSMLLSQLVQTAHMLSRNAMIDDT